MEDIKQYLLSVVICTIICAILAQISGKNGMVPSVLKLLTGLFIIYTVLSPWTKMQISDLSNYFSDLSLDALHAVDAGKESALKETGAIIKSQLEAYILDKASSMDLDISVHVELEHSQPPLPHSVQIKGNASPYTKKRMIQIITDELGIPKENLQWT